MQGDPVKYLRDKRVSKQQKRSQHAPSISLCSDSCSKTVSPVIVIDDVAVILFSLSSPLAATRCAVTDRQMLQKSPSNSRCMDGYGCDEHFVEPQFIRGIHDSVGSLVAKWRSLVRWPSLSTRS